MVTKEDIDTFIQKIPPAPKAVEQTVKYLQVGELGKAAKIASEDRALSSYLRDLVNKPVYGFKTEVKDIAQIFSILGVSGSLQAVYNYLLMLLSPDKWLFFSMNKKRFENLQAELTTAWSRILEHLNIKDKDIEAAIALLPSAIIVSEALFSAHKKDVELIRSAKDIDLNMILQRLSGYTLFDISEMIAEKWEMPPTVAEIVQAASGKATVQNPKAHELGKWMHLLLFYTLSKPEFIEAGLNDFLEFNVEYVSDIYEKFSKLMEIAE